MQFHLTPVFERAAGVFTLVAFAIHWGNRTVGITLFNIVVELEF